MGAGRIRSSGVRRGVECLEQRRRAEAHGPVLVGQRLGERRHSLRRAKIGQRAEGRGTGDVGRVALAGPVGFGQDGAIARSVQLRQPSRRRRAHHRVIRLQLGQQDRKRVRRLETDQGPENGGKDALIRVLEHGMEPRQPGVRRQRAEHGGQRRANVPVPIGVETGQHGHERRRVPLCNRTQRRRPNLRRGIVQGVEQRVVECRRWDRRRGHRGFGPEIGIGLGVLDQREQRGRRCGIAEAPGGTNRFHRDHAVGAGDKRHQGRNDRRILERPQSLDRQSACVGVRVARERQQRRLRPGILETLKRKRHRPPAHAGLAAGVEDDGGERVVGLEAGQREDAEAKRRSRRVAARVFIVTRRLRDSARSDNLSRHARDRIGGRSSRQ